MRIHKLLLLLIFSAFIFVQCASKEEKPFKVKSFNQFEKLKITQIEPKGWIKEFLIRQRSGLTGNIEVAGYPYNTCLWACEKMEGSTKAWWPYEQTAYYLDGVHRLGYLLNDTELIAKAKVNMDYVKNHLDSTGRFGTHLADRWWRWPYASFNRLFMVDYEANGNEESLEILKSHYLTFKSEDFQDDLELANAEELCWIYGYTGDTTFLRMAEKAYDLFKANPENRNRSAKGKPSDIRFDTDRVPDMHGVVYLELAKIPALLYKYTGKEEYLKEAENALAKMEKSFMMAGGLPSTTEHFETVTERAGYEVCNTAVFPYTYGYLLRTNGDPLLGDKIEKAVFNAAIGSVSKDFKSHQYFSAPNQMLATMTSNTFGHNPARNAFLPGHDVECCTGNVNRFMPYYVEQMWLGASEGIVASLYGPSEVSFMYNGKNVSILETTNYPFSNEVEFKIETEEPVEFSLLVRIPEWTKNAFITVNEKPLEGNLSSGSFYSLKRIFNNGDRVKLTLPVEVKLVDEVHNGVSVERGPLVFSLPIAYTQTVVEGYKKSTAEFPGWEFTPHGNWNYALINSTIEVIEKPHSGYPWDEGNSPLVLKAKAKKVANWQLSNEYDSYLDKQVLKTPFFPEKPVFESEVETIELIPYGNTMLRVTVFPKASNE